jgi:hypothetical protein
VRKIKLASRLSDVSYIYLGTSQVTTYCRQTIERKSHHHRPQPRSTLLHINVHIHSALPELTIIGPLSILAQRIKDTDLGKKTIQQGTTKDLPIKLTKQNKRTNRKSGLATYENIKDRHLLLQNL